MQKITNLIIFLLLATCKITASPRDTIYYENNKKLLYDTIPYMIRDQAFLCAFNELQMMFTGIKTYSLKRAEFIVEWAYSGGKMEYSKFCHDIDSVTNILKNFIKVNNIQQFITAPNFALFEYFTKPSPMNENKAFVYDFDDFTGEKDFRKQFVTKVMETHTGQCMSLINI